MSAHIVFCRCWCGFEPIFPFKQFNSVPDDQIRSAIERYVEENKAELAKRIHEVRRKRTKAVAQRRRRDKGMALLPSNWRTWIQHRRPYRNPAPTYWQTLERAGLVSNSHPNPGLSPSPRFFLWSAKTRRAAMLIAASMERRFHHHELGTLGLQFSIARVSPELTLEAQADVNSQAGGVRLLHEIRLAVQNEAREVPGLLPPDAEPLVPDQA